MTIPVICQCGQKLSARDDLLGKTVRCPKCGVSLTIRAAVPVARPLEASVPPPARPGAHTKPAAPLTPPPTGSQASPTLASEFPWKTAPIPRTTGPAYKRPAGQPKPVFPETIPNEAPPEHPWDDTFGARRPAAANGAAPVKAAAHVVAGDTRGWIITETGLIVSLASLIVGGGGFIIMALAAVFMLSSPERCPNS